MATMQNIEIGNRIAAMRKDKGQTQGDMAKALSINRSTLAKWETGEASVGVQEVVMLSKYFNVSCDEIITGNKPEHTNIGNTLGLCSKAINSLKMMNEGDKQIIEKGITVGDIVKDTGLLSKLSKKARNSPELHVCTLLAQGLSALNTILSESGDSLLFLVYQYIHIGELKKLKIEGPTMDGKNYRDDTYDIDNVDAYITDESGNFVRVDSAWSGVKMLPLYHMKNYLDKLANKIKKE